MLDTFYIEPKIKNVSEGNIEDGYDVEKKLKTIKKGEVILITGIAGSGKSCFLKKFFIKNFGKRNKSTVAFWLSSALIKEKKPKNQYSFYKNIIKRKFTSKHKVIVFIDSVDEVFNNNDNNIFEFINELSSLNVSIILGCRKNYYNRFLLEYEFKYVFDIQDWNEEMVKKYASHYLENRRKKELFITIFKSDSALRKFLLNPFQITLLMCIIANECDSKINKINNIYMLYQVFYNEWIFKERKRSSCFIEEKDIIDVHYRIAKSLYKNYNTSVDINKILTKRQRKLECGKDEAILSLIKLREYGQIEKCIAEGFLHDSFCEFFIAKNVINSLLSGGMKIYKCFLLIYRHFNLDFLEEGIVNLPLISAWKIRRNLEQAYFSLMPQSFLKKNNIVIELDSRIRDKYLTKLSKQNNIVRDQCIFFLGKLPESIIKDSKIFKLAYFNDDNILVKICAATVIINHGLDFSIEKDYIFNLLNNASWEVALRSWVVVFWGDVIFDNPYDYVDVGGDWSKIKSRRLNRIQMKNNIYNIKYIRTRAIDLTQLYVFYRNRGWNTMTKDEYDIISKCECDLDLYSNEKKELLNYLKACFKTAWENINTHHLIDNNS